jgi:hypothetical protein
MVRVMKRNCNQYKIKLGHMERNGMHLLAARWDMSFSNVVTLALDAFLREKLGKRDYEALSEDDFTNQLIGETINANSGKWGYDPEANDVPKDKKHYFVPVDNEEMI